jgi:hypothetical protein
MLHPNKSINSDSQERRCALLLAAGYVWRSVAHSAESVSRAKHWTKTTKVRYGIA